MLTINEIFYSIQGESTRAGRPCVFVRLTGCDLRCTWCDTAYAFYEGQKQSVEQVVAAVERYDCPLVEITGGEPLLQAEVYDLMRRLIAAGRTVLLETGGHRPIDLVPEEVIRIVDVKCPGSGEAGHNNWQNLDALLPHDEVKFVVDSEEDWRWALEVIRRHRLPARVTVLVSPVQGRVDPRDLASWILEAGVEARLNLQLHKIVWGADARGV
jgi:7-carboxy-7-deazaguanine synthase